MLCRVAGDVRAATTRYDGAAIAARDASAMRYTATRWSGNNDSNGGGLGGGRRGAARANLLARQPVRAATFAKKSKSIPSYRCFVCA